MDGAHFTSELETNTYIADKREFVQISRAVGVGFIVMGALGYIIKLSTSHHFTQLVHAREAERRDHDQHENLSQARMYTSRTTVHSPRKPSWHTEELELEGFL